MTLRVNQYLHYESISLGHVHPVWDTTENSVMDVRQATAEARILSETYLLQKYVHTFSQYREDPTL